MGGLWQMGGLRKEIDYKEGDVCWWVWWVFRCDAFLLACRGSDWFVVGLIEEELVDRRQGREGTVSSKEKTVFVKGKGRIGF